jgi:protein SCO1/2
MTRLARFTQVVFTALFVAVNGIGVSSAAPVLPSDILERQEAPPKRLEGVDVTERLNASLPSGIPFVTAEGKSVTLGSLIPGERPVLVTMNYSDCPMLCSLQLNGLFASLARVELELGVDYEMITVSLDPDEKPARALETKERYLTEYMKSRGEAALAKAREGWHFVTGSESSIKAVAQTLGIQYGYNEARDEYVHPASVVMLTPDGQVARYLYGVEYHPKTVSLSLVEVSQGKIGGSMERLILFCFHYDETEGRYAPVAMNIMRLSAGLVALSLGSFLSFYWRKERKRKKKKRAAVVTS